MNGGIFMGIICLGVILLGLIIGIIRRNNTTNSSTPETQIFGWLVYGTALAFILLLVIPSLVTTKVGTMNKHYLYIHSLKNLNNIEGNFFLGTGHIKEKEYYYFFYKGEYGYERSKLSVDKVSVVEDDSRRPEIVEVHNKYEQKQFLKFSPSTRNHYIMYVPKNTIIKEFKVY